MYNSKLKIYRLNIMVLIIFILLTNIYCALEFNNKELNPPVSESNYNNISDLDTIDSKIKLAKYFSEEGVKMYGAYWCPYCDKQKQIFESSFDLIEYIECDSKGQNPNLNLCNQKNITSFPTWEINGKLYPGMRTLKNLAVLSNYNNSFD